MFPYGPLTLTDILKMMWFALTSPPPKTSVDTALAAPSKSLFDVKAEMDKLERPLLVVSGSDHSYREAKMQTTTAIRCEEPGRKVTLHEDHYPDEAPGKGFDANEKMKLTRVKVLLVQ